MENHKEAPKFPLKYPGIRAMPFVIGNETFEKLGTIGTSSNLLVYLTTVFNMSNMTATNIVNIFSGTCNFGTLLGAFFSDTYYGRYKTLAFSSVSSFLGMLLLTLTAAISELHPPQCVEKDSRTCMAPNPLQISFLLSSFVLLVIGASGIRPCNLAFGADQFDPNTGSGRNGINSFFNWYYFTYTFAVMVSLTLIVYVQSNVSWSLGLGIPTILMLLSCVLFFSGTRIYVKLIPNGSPLVSITQVVVCAIKKRRLELLDDHRPTDRLFDYVPYGSLNLRLSYTDQFRCLNKAAIKTPEDSINTEGSTLNPWNICSIQQVEEVKCVLRLIPIWLAGIIYYVSIVQQQNYTVFQALQSDRRLPGSNFIVPAASYVLFAMLSITLWLPIYDRIVIPCLRKLTRNEDGLTLLQKIGTGMFISSTAMVVSGLVEDKRKVFFTKTTGRVSSMSGMWLIPQMAVSGLSEAFALIGQYEIFYREFPENMRSIASAFLYVGMAVSSYLSSLFTSVIHRTTNWLDDDLNHGKLDYFYYSIAVVEACNLAYFMICAKWYKYKGTITLPNASMELEKNTNNNNTPRKHLV